MSKTQIDDSSRPPGEPMPVELQRALATRDEAQRQVFDQMRQIKVLQAQIEELRMASQLHGGRVAGSPEAQVGTIAALQKALEDQKSRSAALIGELETLRDTNAAREREMAMLQTSVADREKQVAVGVEESARLTKQLDESKAAFANTIRERDASRAAEETVGNQLAAERETLRESQVALRDEIARLQTSNTEREKQIALGLEQSSQLAKNLVEAKAANEKSNGERDAAFQSLQDSRNQWSTERKELARKEADLRSQLISATKAAEDSKLLLEKAKSEYELERGRNAHLLGDISDKLAQAESQIGALQLALSEKTHQCSELAQRLSLREATLMRRIEEMLVEAIRRVAICEELQAEVDKLRSPMK